MATVELLEQMTADEFGRRPDPGYPEELVRGRVVAMSVPDRRHGYVCGRADRILGNFVDDREIGRVMCNDSGVITQRDPDTVRGADVVSRHSRRFPRTRGAVLRVASPLPGGGHASSSWIGFAPFSTMRIGRPIGVAFSLV